ncbi:MAG: 3-dehydroquinate dehydratase/shikimate dehydrogenase [Pirellulaceae bacterium]|jgi:3-dehydroquinate dehydratase/shikimate dehydrogenase
MICVSIGRGRHKHMMAEHKHLVEQGAQLVELRLDYLTRDVNLKRLVNERPCPIIITVRREQDGGRWVGNEPARQMLLRSAIADGVEYVDLEEDIANEIPRFGKTKRIVSLHNFRETPENLEEIHARLASKDADIVKLATMAHHPHDTLRMLKLIKNADIPTIGICMGDIGTPSRILAGKYGAPFTYATFHQERALAPGQLSYGQMRDIYHYTRINADTDVYGVIADPIGHSLSPLIHNASFSHMGMNRVYVPFRVPREDLAIFMQDCQQLGIKGLSVTIPHKEEVLRFLTKVDGAVRGIGAANTVVFNDNEVLGFNTDYRASMDSIDKATEVKENETPLAGKVAMVLGAGGVAKAIAFGLKRRGADVVITSRTLERARLLAQSLDCRAVDWSIRTQIKPEILVNGTPVGMHPNVDESPFDRRYLRPKMVVFDTVYNPEQTLLIKEARQQNCTVITGVDMFVGQAALQFKLFTESEAPSELMRNEVKRAIGPAKF